jgi:polygalacturonase
VIVRDVAILAAGHFAILATGADNLTLEALKIDTNRDGINVDCCKNVRLSGCRVNSPWDDGHLPQKLVRPRRAASDRGHPAARRSVRISESRGISDTSLTHVTDGRIP